MVLTEKEAKEKRCTPFAVVRLLPRDERDAGIATGALSFNCIGSECMQWRWEDSGRRGYCGLAIAPVVY